ncbi:MAG: hypothetical protein WA418_13350 [Bradyrhizobium sp.]
MTSISALPGAMLTDRSASDLLTLKRDLDALTTQLSSGRIADTYGGLGSARSDSLQARALLGSLIGYDSTLAAVQPRVQLTSASLGQIAKSTTTLRSALINNAADAAGNTALAKDSLDNAVAALNQQIGGRFLFGGRDDSAAPVVNADMLLNGDASDPSRPLAGLRTLVAEQIKADQGDGNGRLTVSMPASATVLVREDADAGARANFGFALAAAPTASGTFASISHSPSEAEGAVPRFAQAPAPNDRFRVVVNQPGAGQKTLDLKGSDLRNIDSAAAAAASLQELVGTGKIASVQSASPPGLTASFANVSAPASFTVKIVAQPAIGDTLTVKLAMRDGSAATLQLQAQANPDPDSTTAFAIGATPGETAQNLSAVMQRALRRATDTALAANSILRATEDFFAGQGEPGLGPRRIDFSGATPAYGQLASTSTVIWYGGDTSASDPRRSVVVRTSATGTLAIGARANEEPIRAALAGFAALALGDAKTTPAAAERWKALSARVLSTLPPRETVDGLNNEFSAAAATMSEAQAQNRSTRAIVQSHLDHLENASPEQLMVEIVGIQNRLQASYQVAAMLSKLSLVNYLR